MTQDQVLLIILVGLVVGNVFLLATMPLRMRRRRPATGPHVRTGPPDPSAGRGDPRAADDARVVAAIETFVTGVSADTTRQATPGIPVRATERPAADGRATSTTPDLARRSITPQWTLAELGDPAMWSRSVREESARAARFGHPVTVVMAELPHLDGLADRFGRGVTDRITTEAARSLASESRAADRIAWLGGARFGVLLPETAELAAGAYVERVRAAADGWLEATGLSIRLSLGWASPAEGGDVRAAAVEAEQRMHAAERRSGASPTILPGPSGTPDSPHPSRRPRRTSEG